MANPGTAVTALWNAQTDKKLVSNASLKQEETQAINQENDFKTFFKDNNLQKIAEESEAVAKTNVVVSKVTTMATLVSSLTSLVGTAGTTSNHGMVTAFLSSRPSASIASSANITKITKPIIVAPTQPLLLPKPNIRSKQVIHTTPPKMGYAPNPSVLTSPLHSSPGHTWQVTSPMNRKRHPDFDVDALDSKRRRTPNRCGPEKGGKGLRHFSMKVCEKVQQKGVTSYNEVADELVQEFSEQSLKGSVASTDQSYDQKNIRRRVYDALNVLMAMNIISKEKKEIKWVGLPTNSAQECKHLEEQKQERVERIRQKQQQLKELIVQQIAFKNLVERNKKVEKKNGPPQTNACIHLPFIIVNTSKKTVIDCSISSDKSEYLFNFDEAFEIHDDIEVLKRMGLSYGLEKGECSEKYLKVARSMVPKSLEPYVLQMANGTYGDMELIELERNARNVSPLATPLSSSRAITAATKATMRGKKRSASSSTSASAAKISRTSTSSPLLTSEYDDTDNDGDDENSHVAD